MRDFNWFSFAAIVLGISAIGQVVWFDPSIQEVTALIGLALVNAILALKVD